MDIPFDQFGGRLVGLAAASDSVGSLAPLDWPGLAARLAAAHAARQILTIQRSLDDSTSGSFAPKIAHNLAVWQASSSPRVNLTPKVDGKSSRPIGRNDAGEDRFIVRGRL